MRKAGRQLEVIMEAEVVRETGKEGGKERGHSTSRVVAGEQNREARVYWK